jgi:hypothetical protein
MTGDGPETLAAGFFVPTDWVMSPEPGELIVWLASGEAARG